jgi:hypothetical protein
LHNPAPRVKAPLDAVPDPRDESMSAKRDPDPPVSDHSYLAAGLFARLPTALDRNDFLEAATSRDALRRLGYVVHVQIPVCEPHKAHKEADRREVTRED